MNSFINLSNHPTAKWSDEQRTAAESYGKIIDMPFPVINPEFGKEELEEIINEYVNQIPEKAETCNLTVHIMGEQCFCFGVITKLKAKGIRCVASTTERVVSEGINGEKISNFKFVRFREY